MSLAACHLRRVGCADCGITYICSTSSFTLRYQFHHCGNLPLCPRMRQTWVWILTRSLGTKTWKVETPFTRQPAFHPSGFLNRERLQGHSLLPAAYAALAAGREPDPSAARVAVHRMESAITIRITLLCSVNKLNLLNMRLSVS
jgi:hypothetical protein